MPLLEKFAQLGLSQNTLNALEKKGFEEPSPVQAQVIPLLLSQNKDIVAQAQTGTGKTAAFGIPLVELLNPSTEIGVQALVLVPTRELAIQVAEELNSLKGDKRLSILAVYGGQMIEKQLDKLRFPVDIVVGTPGRILDHLRRKRLKLGSLSFMILDEADEMLNMGFIEDVGVILEATNPDRRMLMFSATMPPAILDLASTYMHEYSQVSVSSEQLTTSLTDQIYFEVQRGEKFEALCRIIDIENSFYGLIFCRTRVDVDELSSRLVDRGYDAEGLHGDMSQGQREKILDKFKKKQLSLLVATDVAARGIDISGLTHVINFSLPQDPEAYVHRIGRTGRAGKQGTAVTFITPDEYRKLLFIKKVAKTEIQRKSVPKVSEVISQKKQKIKAQLRAIVESEEVKVYQEIAKDMLELGSAEDVVSALLNLSYGQELDYSQYREIRESSVDSSGTTRLFIALGRNNGMTPRKLIDYITSQTKVYQKHIDDLQMFDEFSFITVPFQDAETILRIFASQAKGRKSVVSVAKKK